MISIIVAIASNMAIGKNNDLLWHIPGDLQRFRKITTGHTVIMGKKTYESLPKRPLVNRRNLVITDQAGEMIEGCVMAYSIEEAIALCEPDAENFIIGGASVYRQFLPFTDRLYLTRVDRSYEADVYFPEIDPSCWKLIAEEPGGTDEAQDLSWHYEIYDRVKGT